MAGILTKKFGMMMRVKTKVLPYSNMPWISARRALANSTGQIRGQLQAIIKDATRVEKCTVDELIIKIIPSESKPPKPPAIAVRKKQRIEV